MIARRPILAAVAAGLALAGLRPARAAAPDPTAALVRAFGAEASARAVGAAYLAAHPEEADRDRLTRALTADPATARALATAPADPAALGHALAEAVRRDFLERRMVKLDGWLLARSEARLCALAHLT